MTTATNQNTFQYRLHRFDQFDPVGLGMSAFDFDIGNRRHPLLGKHVSLDRPWIPRTLVGSDQTKRGTGTGHQHPGHAPAAVDPERTGRFQWHIHGPTQAIGSRREMQPTLSFPQRVTNGICVILYTITDRTKVSYITHS